MRIRCAENYFWIDDFAEIETRNRASLLVVQREIEWT